MLGVATTYLEKAMSKDYRYQSEEDWDSVDEDDDVGSNKKDHQRRQHAVKTKQKRDVQRRDKQRRTHFDDY